MDLKCTKCGRIAIRLQSGSLIGRGCTVVCGHCNRKTADGGSKILSDLFGSFGKDGRNGVESNR